MVQLFYLHLNANYRVQSHKRLQKDIKETDTIFPGPKIPLVLVIHISQQAMQGLSIHNRSLVLLYRDIIHGLQYYKMLRKTEGSRVISSL